MAQNSPLGQGLLSIETLISHSFRHNAHVGLLLTSDQPVAERLPDNTQGTDIHAASGIRTQVLSKRAATDQRFRPRGHSDRQFIIHSEV